MVSFTSATVAFIAAIAMVQPIAAQVDSQTPEFKACQDAAENISPAPTYRVFENKDVEIAGLPAVCISQVNTHNALPNIQEINRWAGTITVLNSTAIKVSGAGNSLEAYLDIFCANV